MTEDTSHIGYPGGKRNAAARLIKDVVDHSFANVQRELFGGPDVQVASRVFARCRSRYQSIGLLLAFDQPDDGYALLRGMMLDSQRIQIMALRPPDRLGLAFGWMNEAVRDLNSRARAAEHNGQPDLAASIRATTDRQAIDNERVRVEVGAPRPLRFPSEGRPLAEAAGNPSDVLDYVIASDPTHGSLPTSLWHDRRRVATEVPGEPVGIVIGGNDPAWRDTVADRASRHFGRAMAAMAAVCGLPNAVDLATYANEMERRLDAGELPEDD